jgi:uncharacterized surface protein with fasciclin (FAS1) repeats
MSFNNLLSATAAAALLVGVVGTQAAAQPKTEGAAAAATGKATTDAPANTSVQGTARAVKEGAAPVAAAAVGTPAPVTAIASTPRVTPAGDLIETARASGQFTTFIKAVDATNLTSILKKNPNLTVFAPTDSAFAALPPGELDRLMADKAALQKLMTHHVINARVDSSKIKGAKGPVTTVANDAMELDGSRDVLRADNANIVQADVMASNGVLHVVDQVLRPGVAGASVGAASDAAASTTTTGAAPAPAPATAGQPPAAEPRQ